jgi:YD repeat-containing protein
MLFINITVFAQNNNNYQYDNLNRLIKVTYPNGTVLDYSYDQLGNRTLKTTTSAVQLQSDLVVQNQSLSQTTVSVGASVTASFQIANNGSGSAGACFVKCYLSANQTFEQGSDIEIGSQYTMGVAASSNNPTSINVTIPGTTNIGSWYVLIIVDATNQVSESNENNNLVALPLILINCGLMQANVSTTNSTCGLSNGSASLVISGGNQPYTFSWSNGQSTQTISNLAGGSYNVTITDFYGCIQFSSATVTATTSPSLSFTNTTATCGSSNGSAGVSVSGGTAPYAYLWNNNQTTSTISNLGSGNYSVTVTDASNCIVNGTTTVSSPSNLQASIFPTQPTCGVSNGSLSSQVTGGTLPYTYLWSNSATTSTITGLTSGTYTLVITDSNNCVFTVSSTLSSINSMTVTTSTTSTKCGNPNGTATVNVSNGTPSYQYLWSNNQTSQTATNLSTGVYNVTVTDANGCSTISYATVGAIQPPTVVCTSTPTSCNSNTGTATASVSFGTSPYTYLWSNNQNVQIATALSAGTYSVTITDYYGCSANSSTTVNYNSGGIGNYYPSNGLLAYYPLNNNANDSSGHNLNGSVSGSVSFNGQSALFSSSGGTYITIPDNNSLNNLKRLTILLKVFPSSFDLGCWNGTEILFGKGYDSQLDGYGIGIRRNEDQGCGSATSFDSVKFDFRFKNYIVSSPFYAPNQWFEVAGICDSNYIKIYINGTLVKQDTITSSLAGNTSPIYMNRHTWSGGAASSERFGGKIDEVRLYNRALTLNEINSSTLNQLNISIGNDTTICANQSITLNAGSGFSSYLWSNNANSQSIILSNLNPGQHQYFVEVSACGSTGKDTINITVTPQPSIAGTISGLSSFCSGQSNVQYSIPAIPNATSYLWTLPTGASGTSSTNSITVNYGSNAVSGNISVKGQNTCGEGAASNLSITIQPIPATAGLINTIAGDTVLKGETNVIYKIPTIPDASTYFWNYSGTGATINGNGDSILVDFSLNATSGDLYVRGHNNCGDGLSSVAFPVVVSGTIGIDNALNDDNIQIFPNPTNHLITIQFPTIEERTIEIFDIEGRLLKMHNTNKYEINIDLSSYSNGIYLIKVKSSSGVYLNKIIKN